VNRDWLPVTCAAAVWLLAFVCVTVIRLTHNRET
jgi:hypothetical protein